jgi:hypothetical protein
VEALGAREPSAAGANDGSSTTVRAACGTRVDRRLAISAHCRLFQRPPVEGSPQRRHYVKKPILPSPRRPGRSFPTDRYPARAVLSLATKPSLRREQRQQRVGAEDGTGRARSTDAAQPAAAHPVEAVTPAVTFSRAAQRFFTQSFGSTSARGGAAGSGESVHPRRPGRATSRPKRERPLVRMRPRSPRSRCSWLLLLGGRCG